MTEESDSELEVEVGEDDDDEYFAVVGADDDEDGRPVSPSELGAPEAVAALKAEILARALAVPLTALCDRLVDRLRATRAPPRRSAAAIRNPSRSWRFRRRSRFLRRPRRRDWRFPRRVS